ncbi:hypothetical protein E2C01_045254 [Portunus trituberculatus]|uniref:Uncharacterized protein n=1 Tax=Portunus trituberculatus TaxID=210409 RepID=A0A5B7FUH2_PORTR|nr:hypothetical protein [Portunus trituberculatus]
MSFGRYQESVGGEKEDDSSGTEDCLPETSPIFTAMMDFICEKFPKLNQVLLQLCAHLGIHINYDESCLQPAQEIVYLGVNVRTPLLKAFPTQTQVDNHLSHLQASVESRLLITKEWLTLQGHMASLTHLVPGAQLHMWSLCTHFLTFNDKVQQTLCWAEDRAIVLKPQFISGSRNVVTDSLSRKSQVISME